MPIASSVSTVLRRYSAIVPIGPAARASASATTLARQPPDIGDGAAVHDEPQRAKRPRAGDVSGIQCTR